MITFYIQKEYNTLDCYLIHIPTIGRYSMSENASSPNGVCLFMGEDVDISDYKKCNTIPNGIIKQVCNLLSY